MPYAPEPSPELHPAPRQEGEDTKEPEAVEPTKREEEPGNP